MDSVQHTHFPIPPLGGIPLSNTQFTLNAWGLAGVFGGEEAISAMTITPLFHGKRWLGWYNSPGSLEVARHFSRLAQSHYWERLFPHRSKSPYSGHIHPFKSKSPAHLFGLDGRLGPKYTAAFSATEIQTGHLGYLAMERCKEIREATEIPGRITSPAHVALIDLGKVDYEHDVLRLSKIDIFLAIFPIIVSIVTCVLRALVYDWYSFSTICISILASGFAGITIGGSVKLEFKSVMRPAPDSLPGNGILVPVIWENIIVVVKGPEAAVNAITKGNFGLELGGRVFQYAIVLSAFLLIADFVSTLPHSTRNALRPVHVRTSLCVSWICNFRISSMNRERLQAEILFRKLGKPHIRKFLVQTRTTMAAFVALLVYHDILPLSLFNTHYVLFSRTTPAFGRSGGRRLLG